MSIHQNPFVGLRAFESDESLLFFGRQQQTLELLQHLHENHFVAIVGSSGSGKSSLIRAGLIPSLKAGYLIEERDKWLLAVMKPGQSPLYNLTKAIVCEVAPNSNEAVIEQLLSSVHEEGADAITDYLTPVVNNNTNIFLLVDQFEELFRFSADNQDADKKNEAIDFVNILLDIAQQTELPVYIVITMRSDFIGDCAQFYGLPEAMNKSQYLVPRLSRMQLKNVITGPLSVNGAAIEQTLLNQLLNDAGDNPDQLPVLQHVLMRTWEVWKTKETTAPLSIEDYKKTGTLRSALSQHAEEAYTELGNGRLQYICELVFKALTDKKLNARGVRRPQTFANLLLLTGATEDELRKVIDTFRTNGRTFLMPSANVVLTQRTIIDISHESLMRVWTRLIQWVEEESESEQVYLRLSEAALLYKQKRGGLWRNPELELALQWKDKNDPNAVWAGQINNSFEEAIAFLELSRERNEQEILDKKKEQRRRLKRARSVAAVIGAIAFVSIWLMIYAFRQKADAIDQRKHAMTSAHIAKKKEDEANVMRRQYQREYQRAVLSNSEALIARDSALVQKNRADSLANETNIALVSVRESRAAALLAKKDAENQEAHAINAEKNAKNYGERMQAYAEETNLSKLTSDTIKNIVESSNIANEALDEFEQGQLDSSRLMALTAYEQNRDYKGPAQNDVIFSALNYNWMNSIQYHNLYNTHKQPVRCISIVPNSNMIVTGDESGLIDIALNEDCQLQHISSEKTKINIRSIAVFPDGKKLVAVSSNGKGLIYSLSSAGILSHPFSFSFTGVGKQVCFDSSNSFLLLSSSGIYQFQVESSVVQKNYVSSPAYQCIALSKIGKLYIALRNSVYTYNNFSELVNKPAGNKIHYDSLFTSTITSLAVDNDEQYMSIGGYSGKVIIINLSTNQSLALSPQQSSINYLQFAKVAGGKLQLAIASADKTIELVSVKDKFLKKYKENDIVLRGHTKWVYGLAYNEKGTILLSCGEDNKVIAWKPTSYDLYRTLIK